MIPLGMRPIARLALAAGSAVLLFTVPTSANEVAPFRTALVVRWGASAGSDAFRDELEHAAAASLATRCFAGVAVADRDAGSGDTDLVLVLGLSEVVDEIRYDDSIAGALQPGEPTQELRRVARFTVAVDAELTTRESATTVRRKHFVVNAVRRPMFVGEDPQATVRAQAIRDVADALVRNLGCGRTKLERNIRDALGQTGPAASGAR
jgi:hypothetical protein